MGQPSTPPPPGPTVQQSGGPGTSGPPPTSTAGTTPKPAVPPSTPPSTPPPTAVPAPAPVQLLSSPWSLSGSNGAAEAYQSVPGDVLAGRDRVRITYDLHGLQAQSNDASAVIIDQGSNDACVNRLPDGSYVVHPPARPGTVHDPPAA